MRKEVLIVLVTFCLAATLFSIIPVGSQGVREYDAWFDVTGPIPGQPDGKIDLRDYYAMGLKFGTEGDPTKNVNVTNWPEFWGSAKKGINQSLAFNLAIPKGDIWRSSSLLVDGYRQIYLFVDILNPSRGIVDITIYYIAGGIESEGYYTYINDNDYSYLFGPIEVKGPAMELQINNNNPTGGNITLSAAVYAPA